MANIDAKTKSSAVIAGFSTLATGWGLLPIIAFILMGLGPIGIISIPLLIIGALIGLAGLVMTISAIFARTIKIECPYCRTKNKVLADTKTFSCHECTQKVFIQQGRGAKLTLT